MSSDATDLAVYVEASSSSAIYSDIPPIYASPSAKICNKYKWECVRRYRVTKSESVNDLVYSACRQIHIALGEFAECYKLLTTQTK